MIANAVNHKEDGVTITGEIASSMLKKGNEIEAKANRVEAGREFNIKGVKFGGGVGVGKDLTKSTIFFEKGMGLSLPYSASSGLYFGKGGYIKGVEVNLIEVREKVRLIHEYNEKN